MIHDITKPRRNATFGEEIIFSSFWKEKKKKKKKVTQ